MINAQKSMIPVLPKLNPTPFVVIMINSSLTPESDESLAAYMKKLSDIVHAYSGTPTD